MNTKFLQNNNHDNTHEKEIAYQSKMEIRKKKEEKEMMQAQMNLQLGSL